MIRDCPLSCMLDSLLQQTRVVVLDTIVIMVEDVQKMGDERISEAMEVGEMVTQAEARYNQVGKSPIMRTWLSVMPFRARPRWRHLMQ